ncbi:DNA topoisomerase IB [Oceaniglobus roseus]|uniref:DNA topoisomerase IB n=1 Tax=Oceaniglobus roseus TaxID=1737570 RepID=UPI000C7F08D3|nr:DNA topoisomerase IB [Kandeliimicrobium roseum]
MSPIPGLVYYPDTRPGITRRKAGRGFTYRAPDGTTIDCKVERKRLAALAVPPAYVDVWICPKPNGHLQATGKDTRARKQYRYHPDWTSYRSEKKFGDLAAFGTALPAIRRRILKDLKEEAGSRPFALAALLAMLDRLSMRIGTPEYAAENGSFGATTLRRRHVKLDDKADGLRLSYTAKGGQKVRRSLKDATLQRALHRLEDLPGATLVRWIDDDGDPHSVSSEAVNALLEDISGVHGLTAKTFRTWNGSAAAMDVALRAEDLTIKAMADTASERLANTPTIARNSYIHPKVIDLAGTPLEERRILLERAPAIRGLRRDEAALMHLLQG